MKIIDPYKKHFFALAGLFALGDAVIVLPENSANKFTFLGFLVSVLLSVCVVFLVFSLKNEKKILLPAGLLTFYLLLEVFLTFVVFISNNLLPKTPKIFIILPFVLIAVFVAFKEKSALLKFSLISFVFTNALIGIFFLSTAKDFNVQNIYVYSFPNLKNFYIALKPYIKRVVLPTFVLSVYARLLKIEKKATLSGLLCGNLLLGICILNSVLLFGIGLSAKLSYPYADAISTVTFGNLFTRMDGFAYFIYLASSLVKISVCVQVIKALIIEKTGFKLNCYTNLKTTTL